MRFRAKIGGVMLLIAAVGIGLAGFLEWRRGLGPGPSASVRLARTILDGRSTRPPSGPSTRDLTTFGALVLAVLVGGKIAQGRPSRTSVGVADRRGSR